MSEQMNARFQLKDARITRVKELPKVCFLTVLCQAGKYPNYYDLVVFTPPPGIQLEEGLAVTVNGELSKRKPKDGEKNWELQLVARSFTRGDDSAAPRPKRSTDNERGSYRKPERYDGPPADDDIAF